MKSLAFFKREAIPVISLLRTKPETIFLQSTRKDFPIRKTILEYNTVGGCESNSFLEGKWYLSVQLS